MLTAAGLVGAALSPYLLVKNPLLLVAISPAAHHVALAAATVDPPTLIAVATLRRLLLGLCAYGLGYIYGRVSFEWLGRRYPRLGRWLGVVERLFARRGVALLGIAPRPDPGVARRRGPEFRLLPFMLALTLGNVIWTTLTYYLGDAIALWTDQLIAFLSAHLFESTALCILAVGLQQAISRGLAAHQRLRQQSTPSK